MVRNRSYVFFSARLCQNLPEMFADSKLLRPQVLSIAHYILQVDASTIKHSPSRFHAKVVALVSGTAISEILLYDNPVAGAANEAKQLHDRRVKTKLNSLPGRQRRRVQVYVNGHVPVL
uniref:Uncharacterized protein n=1 Tax=Hyaloperonospora arabidopsidis (strain Emoy2) TaxID=559515 RepID=M4BI23_HYAAE